MNKITSPDIDDVAAITRVSNNMRIKCRATISADLKLICDSYEQYMAAQGHPAHIGTTPISPQTGKCLQALYSSPPSDLAHIREIRTSRETHTCPMCGSMHCGTLDHYLPKNGYPVFSVFSKNLVPACSCNGKRGESLFGTHPDERVLHPYFDQCLDRRLLYARIEALGSVPKISIALTVFPTDPLYRAIDFHVKAVVRKTGVLKYLSDRWSAFFRKPDNVVRAFRDNLRSEDEVRHALERELACLDDLHGSKNNWNSMFVFGMLEPHVVAWLSGVLSAPGRGPNSPLGHV